MRTLFGNLCSTSIFRHDQEMNDTLKDPLEDETQKSCCEFSNFGSPTSSEDGGYENDSPGDDDEKSNQGHKLNIDTVLAATGTVLLKDMRNNNSGEQGTCAEVDATSTLLKACSNPSRLVPAQPLRSSQESETRRLRRRASLDNDNDRSNCKRVRLNHNHASVMANLSPKLEMPEPEEGSQPAIAAVPRINYYDTNDRAYRCGACGWEVLRPEGACTGCGAGESAYYEVTSLTDMEGSNGDQAPKTMSESRNHNVNPRICLSSNAAEDGGAIEVKTEQHTKVTGNYLDGASAYESAPTSAENECEINSFIDDSSVDIGIDEHTDASASDDVEYKTQLEELASASCNLEQEREDFMDDHEAFRRDMLGSDSNDSGNQDELDFDVVNIEVQDPPISEVVLFHVQGDSQSSAISISRLRTRADAFLAAPEGWHNISLMSTGDNHTEESQEL